MRVCTNICIKSYKYVYILCMYAHICVCCAYNLHNTSTLFQNPSITISDHRALCRFRSFCNKSFCTASAREASYSTWRSRSSPRYLLGRPKMLGWVYAWMWLAIFWWSGYVMRYSCDIPIFWATWTTRESKGHRRDCVPRKGVCLQPWYKKCALHLLATWVCRACTAAPRCAMCGSRTIPVVAPATAPGPWPAPHCRQDATRPWWAHMAVVPQWESYIMCDHHLPPI